MVPVPLDLPVEVDLPDVPAVVVPAPADLLPTSAPTPQRAAPMSHGGTHVVAPPLPELKLPPVGPVQRRPKPPAPPPPRLPAIPGRTVAAPPVARPSGGLQGPTGRLRLPGEAPVARVGGLPVTGAEAYGATSGLVMLLAGLVLWRWTRRCA